MIDWKKVFNKRSIVGSLILLLGGIFSTVSVQLVSRNTPYALVMVCTAFSILCNISSLVVMVTGSAPHRNTSPLTRVMRVVLPIAFLCGVGVGIYLFVHGSLSF